MQLAYTERAFTYASESYRIDRSLRNISKLSERVLTAIATISRRLITCDIKALVFIIGTVLLLTTNTSDSGFLNESIAVGGAITSSLKYKEKMMYQEALIDKMMIDIFGDVAKENIYAEEAKSALYAGLDTRGRFDIIYRRNKNNKTNPLNIPVHDIHDDVMYDLDDDGKPLTKDGHKVKTVVPLYNTFLEDDVRDKLVSKESFRFIDISALLQDKSPDEQALVVKNAIQRGLFKEILAAKKGNAVDTPIRLLCCNDLDYAKTRNVDFFISPQDLIAYGKVLVTSHEVIAKGTFRVKVVEEGYPGTGDGQSRITTQFARELGIEGFGQLQFRLELLRKLLVTGSFILSSLGEEVDMVIPVSNFKGGHEPAIGTYDYDGRLGIMANSDSRKLRIRDNFEIQHYYRDIDWKMVSDRIKELLGAHQDPQRYLELIGDTEEKQEDFAVVNAILKAVPMKDDDSRYVAMALIRHPYIASKIKEYMLSNYADLATTGNHYFNGSYLACLESLPDGYAYAKNSTGKEWVFRIPMLSAGNIVKLTMVDDDYMYGRMNGDKVHDAEILAALHNKGSIFVNSNTAARLNSDFDMDPMCRCGEDDPYFVRLEEVHEDWGTMSLIDKDKKRNRSPWGKFGVSEAVADFIAAPNIGALTLLQHNIMSRKNDSKTIKFLKSIGLTVLQAAELIGLATQIAVDYKWNSNLSAKEEKTKDILLKHFTGKSPFHRNIIKEIRAGNTDWDIEGGPDTVLEKLVCIVRDALKANDIDDELNTFRPGTYVGFLGLPNPATWDLYRAEVLERVQSYNKAISKILNTTKPDSRKRKDAISKVCEINRMDFAYLRSTMTHDSFMDIVRLGWDAGHQAAERSNNSKASFIFTAGVVDVIVECLNFAHGGIGHVMAKYSDLKEDQTPAPRIRLFEGWRQHLGLSKEDTAALLKHAFQYEDTKAQEQLEEAAKKWAATVKGQVVLGTTINGKTSDTCLFAKDRIVGEVRTSLVELGRYVVEDVTVSGLQLIAVLRPVINRSKVVRHNMRATRLWQNVETNESKATKAARTVKTLRTAMKSAKIVPGERGLEIVSSDGDVIAAVYAGDNQSMILGDVRMVDVQHIPGKLSANITVDRIYNA